MTEFPSLATAEKIFEDGILYRRSRPYPFDLENEYRFHCHGVAKAARILAAHIDGLDAQKAYILGLLHDYGKRINQNKENRFHGIEGYYAMQELGYSEIARICLTHSFAKPDFADAEYSLPQAWLDEVRQLLKGVVYDDYDRLICFCDKFFEGLKMVMLEERIRGITQRYSLNLPQQKSLEDECYGLKKYFNSKIGCDVYQLLGLK